MPPPHAGATTTHKYSLFFITEGRQRKKRKKKNEQSEERIHHPQCWDTTSLYMTTTYFHFSPYNYLILAQLKQGWSNVGLCSNGRSVQFINKQSRWLLHLRTGLWALVRGPQGSQDEPHSLNLWFQALRNQDKWR